MSQLERFQPWIDACRVLGDELSQPELRELAEALASDAEVREAFERSQQWDMVFQQALEEEPVPADLQQKLLERFGEPADVAPLWPRRLWLVGLAAAACLLLVSGWALLQGGSGLDASRAAQEAAAWADQLASAERSEWNSAEPPRGYEIDPAVQMPPNFLWKPFAPWDDPASVAYASPGREVLLVVLKSRRVGAAPDAAPLEPQSSTGAYCVGVWKRNDLTYVLLVKGGPAEYRQAILNSVV